jgi:D-3-phosphoglycerate dehydrogenase
VVGCGDIGLEVVQRLQGFDVDVVGYDPYVSESEMRRHGIRKTDFESLCAEADVVTVHTPLTESTRHLIDADAFDSMAPGTTLVNAARGGIVDQAALHDAIEDGTVAYAGLDVLENEPPEDDQLLGFDNVVVTPHAAWYSEDALAERGRPGPRRQPLGAGVGAAVPPRHRPGAGVTACGSRRRRAGPRR